MYDCISVKGVWLEIMNNVVDGSNINLNARDVILGLCFNEHFTNSNEISALNIIVLMGKMYLWTCHTEQKVISFRGYLSTLRDLLMIYKQPQSITNIIVKYLNNV